MNDYWFTFYLLNYKYVTETYTSNRNVNLGDTFDDVIEAFGCQEYKVNEIYINDAYRSYFINSNVLV